MVLTAFMKRCKFCRGRVSINADSCPHCGADLTPLGNLLIGLAVTVLIAVCVWMFTKGLLFSSSPAQGNLPLAQTRLPAECTYLSRFNMPTSEYKPAQGGEYRCVSQVRHFDEGAPYTLHYQASGTPTQVRHLILQLEVRSRQAQVPAAHTMLMQYGSTLAVHTLNTPLPLAVAQAIRDGVPGDWWQEAYRITLQRIDLPEGYMLSLQLALDSKAG